MQDGSPNALRVLSGRRLLKKLICAAFVVCFIQTFGLAVAAQDQVDFAHDILPILKSKCAECHSNGTFKGGLSLENREALLDSGVVEINASHESELIDRLTSTDPNYQMPPNGERLDKTQVKKFARWIDQGMIWPSEISLRKPTFKRNLALDATIISKLDSTKNRIDAVLDSYFPNHNITPPTTASDQQFIRRTKLDLLGLLPTQSEIENFANEKSPDRHDSLVKEFLSQNRSYADHWLSFWNDLLRNDYAGTGYIDGGRTQITKWLHRSLHQNKPYDQFVRELINPKPEAEGFAKGIKWRGRVNASQIPPLQFSQNVSQIFLGINMKCASCHDSFIDDWKLEDAYGLAAVIADKPLAMHRCDVPNGKFAKANFVFSSLGKIESQLPKKERLEQLATLITTPENGRFARTIVNRLWTKMTGHALVKPVDVMAKEAWSEQLLEVLAMDLVEHDYDLKRTLELIATSSIYRRKTVSTQSTMQTDTKKNTQLHDKHFLGVRQKRMTAEQFVDAVWQLTGTAPKSPTADIGKKSNDAVPFVRASLVPSNALMRSLGRPNREQVVTSRPSNLTTFQALVFSNGDLLAEYLKKGATQWIGKKEQNSWSNDKLIESLFSAAMSRAIRDNEMELLRLSATNADDLKIELEDVMWMILMLPEFQLIQ